MVLIDELRGTRSGVVLISWLLKVSAVRLRYEYPTKASREMRLLASLLHHLFLQPSHQFLLFSQLVEHQVLTQCSPHVNSSALFSAGRSPSQLDRYGTRNAFFSPIISEMSQHPDGIKLKCTGVESDSPGCRRRNWSAIVPVDEAQPPGH